MGKSYVSPKRTCWATPTIFTRFTPRLRTGSNFLPFGTQIWRAAKSPDQNGSFLRWENHRTKWGIVHCHDWLPEGRRCMSSWSLHVLAWPHIGLSNVPHMPCCSPFFFHGSKCGFGANGCFLKLGTPENHWFPHDSVPRFEETQQWMGIRDQFSPKHVPPNMELFKKQIYSSNISGPYQLPKWDVLGHHVG